MTTDPTNNHAHVPNFCERVFARPHLDGEDPTVSTARRTLEECAAGRPDDFEIWDRYGALQATVQGLLDLMRGQASPPRSRDEIIADMKATLVKLKAARDGERA